MRRGELVCGAVLLALAAGALIEAFRIQDDWQGARLMPAVLGLVLAFLGAGHLMRRARGVSEAVAPAWPEGDGWRRVGLAFGGLVAYVFVLPHLGFLPATAAFLLGLLGLLGTYSWPMVLVLTAIASVASHVIFKVWLTMPLPAGPLGL